jgi:hypothetical protein
MAQQPYKSTAPRGAVSGISEVPASVRHTRLLHDGLLAWRALMRAITCIALASLLAGCSWMGSGETSTPVPSPSALEGGDCHTLAQEHEAEAAWREMDADSQKHVFAAAYDDCQQWKAAHAWTGAGQ